MQWIALQHEEGNSVPRWHAPRGAGGEVVRVLAAAASARGARWQFGTRVRRLLTGEGGRVTGVAVQTEAGERASDRTVGGGGHRGLYRLG